ncbi:CRAL-TRIO domain-containing protein [Epithele typhae]|uniref:CRAL-TRIO domain-containing protein n=1 Tax=Epithele typhae TaxID=378194 RepID=UPI002008EB16|nr:CRAL-TRIO domain-containing protein [Epithele typhae]KAH9936891.1 CRAL-TRIO domain-containing protein [Epithele typhae]
MSSSTDAPAAYQPPPGRVGNLTETQEAALAQLKQELEAEGKLVPERMDDPTLLRFLRARKFDVEKAKLMLLECEKWRVEFGVDDLTKNFDFKEKEEVDKYYPQYYHKTDKEGRPIYVERLGKLDIKALYALTSQERQLQRLVYEYEKFLNDRLPACSAAVGHPVETSCTILDLQNVSLSAFYSVKDYVAQASKIGQDRYPETMGRFYIINAPWAFSAVWTVIKPWLDPATVAKIDILGGGYKDKLLAVIPVENLPKEFGGTCQCPGGCSLSDAGPWNVPKAV